MTRPLDSASNDLFSGQADQRIVGMNYDMAAQQLGAVRYQEINDLHKPETAQPIRH
jgi:hypothetical protein